ncbi:MAG: hypothetical protein A4S12_08540 [Proteobacteria bacterium SG_bin5]|nr:MAG: hypothetical protein A4S12_08540 [Proteobacteria bacterium SG_bin5]
MTRALLLLLALLLGAGAARAAPARGSFVDLPKLVTKNLPEPVHVTIWLPPGYARGKARYPVIYMHDGQNLFFPKLSGYNKVWAADKAMLALIAEGETKGAIIVGVWHQRARAAQYFPRPIYDALPAALRAEADRFAGRPVYSDGYLRFLVEELKPLIDRRYRTLEDRGHTIVAGSSMGGLISLAAIARYPQVFGAAACVSTHWPLVAPDRAGQATPELGAIWDQFFTDKLGAPAGRRIWFDHGDQTLDQYYGPWQSRVDARLIGIGWRPGEDFETKAYPGTGHEENAWAARLPEIFAWLLRAPE